MHTCTRCTTSLSLISHFTVIRCFCFLVMALRLWAKWMKEKRRRERCVKYHMIFYESACTVLSIHLSLSLWVAGAQYVCVSVCVLLNIFCRFGMQVTRGLETKMGRKWERMKRAAYSHMHTQQRTCIRRARDTRKKVCMN